MTHPFVAKIAVTALADAVQSLNADAANAAIQYAVTDDRFAVTGGELMHVRTNSGPLFYQVFGHRFEGSYGEFVRSGGCDGFVSSVSEGDPIESFYQFQYYKSFTTCSTDTLSASYQSYPSEIRRFRLISDANGAPIIAPGSYAAIYDTAAVTSDPDSLSDSLSAGAKADILTRFRRRDLPVTPMIGPDGQQGFSAWGGVFRPLKINDAANMWSGFTDVIHFTRDAEGNEGYAFRLDDQVKSSIYSTASFVAYDANAEGDRLYTTLIGGINAKEAWINDITTFIQSFDPGTTEVSVQVDAIKRPASDASDELVAAPMGSEGEFILGEDVPLYQGREPFIDFPQLPSGTTSIGHLFGGITTKVVTNNSGGNGGTNSAFIVYEVFLTKP